MRCCRQVMQVSQNICQPLNKRENTHISNTCCLWFFLSSWNAPVRVSATYCAHTWRIIRQRFTQYPFGSKYLLWHLCSRDRNWERGEVRMWMHFQYEKFWKLTVLRCNNKYITLHVIDFSRCVCIHMCKTGTKINTKCTHKWTSYELAHNNNNIY